MIVDTNKTRIYGTEGSSDVIWKIEEGPSGSKEEETAARPIRLTNAGIAGSLSTTTGWTTWDSAVAVIRYLTTHRKKLVEGKNLVDMSTGNGLVALACAALGAESVLATEVEACIALPKQNVALNCRSEDNSNTSLLSEPEQDQQEQTCWARHVDCQVYHIGAASTSSTDKEESKPTLFKEPCDLVIICDLLFISIRDEFDQELRSEIIKQCRMGSQVLFAYEERVCNKEYKFLSQFSDPTSEVIMEEIPSSEVDTSPFKPESEEDNDRDGNDLGVNLFYESPPVRLFMFRKMANTAEDDKS